MVKLEKEYTFQGANSTAVTLADLFGACNQLIVYHFMYSPDDSKVCHGCSHIGESLPDVRHLRLKDTNLVCISRAPFEKLDAFKKENAWTFPWYSSANSDFNYDFHATLDEAVCPPLLNFRTKAEAEEGDKTWFTGDVPGFSVFYKKNGEIYHTYSTFARGSDRVMPTLSLLDMTPLGRQIGPYGPAEFRLKSEYGPL